MGLVIIAALFLWKRSGRSLVFIPIIAFSAVMIVLSGSRGGLLSVLVAALVFAVCERLPLRRFIIGMLAIGGVLFVVILNTSIGRMAIELAQERIVGEVLSGNGGDGVYWSGRDELYAAAIDLGAERPLVGTGLGGFEALTAFVETDTATANTYPHNLILELFCETGIVGVLLFVALVVMFCRDIWSHRRTVDGAAVAGWMLVFVSSQFSGDIYDNRLLFLLMTPTFAIRSLADPPITDGKTADAAIDSQ
jgi:O-antigen ligase